MENYNKEPIVNDVGEELLPNGGYTLHTFEDIRAVFSLYIKNEEDVKNIEKAYLLAQEKHAGVFRKSGEPYLHHLIEVAYICAALQSGPVTLISAFLHDLVEDTDYKIEEIKKQFGEDVANIVDALTKIQRLKLSKITQEEFVAEDHKKIFLGMARDVRVIIIKLADRLHNLRTIASLKTDRRIAIAEETLSVFAPIAHRLGIYRVESELEDLSLKILKPEVFNSIQTMLNEKVKNRMKQMGILSKKIADLLLQNKFEFEISSRVKSIYSIYKKMYVKNYRFDEIYDVFALRIITQTELNCYEILGIVHQNFKPIPGRFKDYIAMPKPNLYQSLHTSIISGKGEIFEVQIRTKEMDEIAEEGVAAHWRYKERKNYNAKQEQKEIEEKLHWFRDFVSISNEAEGTSSTKEYLETLNTDIFDANVYVFTPKGKVIDLPNGSTPLDMAYKIHTKVGDSCVGALINGNLVPLNTPLKTGDVCEIKTSNSSSGPNEEWLKYVKTSSAKNKIKKFLLKRNLDSLREDKIRKGKELVLDFFADRDYAEKEVIALISTENVLKNYHCDTVDDLFVNVTNHNPSTSQLASFVGIRKKEATILPLSKKENFDDDNCPVYVENASGLKITLGNCCTPIPGDKIVGYVTKGLGITVHRDDCPNVSNETKRLIDVLWKHNLKDLAYPVDVIIDCNDRPNLLIDILNMLASIKIKVTEIQAKFHSSNYTTTISCQIYVKNHDHLLYTIAMLKNLKDVYEVRRTIH
ncbi:MAG TPA: bifunctional (p)ppGpp synthetase/guanosine-3',5'-bis(diphosphate) 3'-pyrophosphohydrolase [Candidatus Onthovivens sp.]|nr:bifunctional (p)ppGpp synthetase/guanosine-3',5'-bis(diphosphate) 3'-pyrophosphohydrolase [Candidatus Onthovivens sp.]